MPSERHRAAVLGSPIAHSLSPALHRAAYAELGLEGWSYAAYDVGEAALAGFVQSLDGSWAGLSLTMPLKRAVLPLLEETSEVVEQTGAANTLVLRAGRRFGDNTDVPGLVQALRERGAARAERPVVLGGGATAASALAALARLGAIDVRLVTRRAASAVELQPVAERVGLRIEHVAWAPAEVARLLSEADVVVATATAGAADVIAAELSAGDLSGVLLDAIYDPWPTALAAAWGLRGGGVASGLDLLVHQAALQVVAMTGRQRPGTDPSVLTVPMRVAGLAALEQRRAKPQPGTDAADAGR